MSGLVSHHTQEHSSDNIFKCALSPVARVLTLISLLDLFLVHTLGIVGRAPKTGFHKTRFTHVHVSIITKFDYQQKMDGLIWFVYEIV